MIDWAKQILIGTILGGSSLVKPKRGKNCYLIMRSRNKQWLNYKISELSFLGVSDFSYSGQSLRWRSDCYAFLTEIYNNLYYNNEKRVSMEILNTLRDIGLAIWFGDKGYLRHNKIIININYLNNKDIIQQYFNEIGLFCNSIQVRKSVRLEFTEEASKKFLMVIGEKLPSFMLDSLI